MCYEDIQDIAKHQFSQPDMRWWTITEMFITYRLSLWNFWHFHNHNKSGPFCTPSFKRSFRSRQIEIVVCCYWKGQDWRNFCNQTVNTPIYVSGCVIVWTLAITFNIQHIRLVKACSNSLSKHYACRIFIRTMMESKSANVKAMYVLEKVVPVAQRA